jgi:uncharacterized repeat protein (TIGR02059 family)
MKKNLKPILTGIFITLISLSGARSQNLISNGGFEDGTNSWEMISSGGSTVNFQIIQSDVYNGSNALKINISNPGTSPKDISLTKTGFAVQKDIIYLLTFWAKADTTGKEVGIKFSSTATSSFKPYDSAKVYLSAEWKKYEVVFPSPVATDSDIQFSFYLGYNNGIILLDEVSIEKKGNSWYEGAEYRIDKYRKGNFGIKVIDAGGDPISDSIIIQQTKHEFPWGTPIDIIDRPIGTNYTSPSAVKAPADSEIYRIERYAQYLPYKLPAIAGQKYQLTIKMSENYWTSANKRLFDLSIDGTRVMQNIDKYVLAGARYKACDSTVTIIAADTIIRLEFLASMDNVAIMGLVLADSVGTPILRLNCSPSTIITHDGNTYISDLTYIDIYAATPNTSEDDYKKAVMLKYCNYGVCGNQFKWSGIEPTKGVINYAPFDNTLGWFNKVGWEMRAHTLLWGGTSSTDYHELPQWVGQLAPSVMYDTCKMRIRREMTRYRGIVKEYDVINEPLHANYLQSRVGDSINWNCFKWAREADPDARLFINEYNIFEYQNDCDNFTNLMHTLVAHGAPIDGIGSQAHFGTSIDVAAVKSRIDKLSQFGLPIKVTEFDMDGTSITQQNHANEVAKMMRLSFSHPSIEGFIIWGLFDPGWRSNVSNLFATDKTPKVVADTVYQLIHEKWNTHMTEKTDTSGTYFYRGFYGDYDVIVRFGDTWQKYKIHCDKINEGQVFTLTEDEGMPLSPKLKKVHINAPSYIELTFDKKMLDPSVEYRNFKVFDTLTNAVQSAALKAGDSLTIVLTMKSAMKKGYYIPVSYYPGNIKSADGGVLEAFGPELDDSYSPAFIAASTTKNGKAIAVNFKVPVELSSAKAGDFTLKINNVATSATDFTINDTKDSLFLNIASQIISDLSTITISYKPGTLITIDSLSVVAFLNKPVTNTIVIPEIVSAATSKDGATIQVRFSQTIASTSINSSDFMVSIDGSDNPVVSAEILSTSYKYVVLTLENPVIKGATITVTYTPGSLTSIYEIPVQAFSINVTNKVTTSIDEISNTNTISFYPNPVSDWLNVTNTGNYQRISISNITGQEVYAIEIPSSGKIIINTKLLKPGVYLIILRNNSDTAISKFVKQ